MGNAREIICPKCGAKVLKGLPDCAWCGAPLSDAVSDKEKLCPKCFAVVMAGLNECPFCGAAVTKSKSMIKDTAGDKTPPQKQIAQEEKKTVPIVSEQSSNNIAETDNKDIQKVPKVHMSKRSLIIIGTVSTVIIVLLLVLFVIIPSTKFNNAVSAIEKGQYDEAIAYFSENIDYRDSSFYLSKAHYMKGERLLSQSNYAEAIEEFIMSGKYKDAEERVKQSYCLLGTSYRYKGDYKNAIECFNKAQDFSNARTQAVECAFLQAVENYNAGNYEEAYVMFCLAQETYDFKEYMKDENMKAVAATYKAKKLEEGRLLCTEGKYQEAAEVYCAIPDYDDDTKLVIRYFADILEAVTYNNGFYIEGINDSSYAKSHAVYIEKNYKSASRKEIRQMYYATEAVLYTSIDVYSSSDYDIIEQGRAFARLVDRNYDGPFAEKIIALANYVVTH